MQSPHRGYYAYPSVRAAFDRRLEALRAVIPPGSEIVDLGCNDGSVGRALLASGHARRVVGFDVERMFEEDREGFEFVEADLGARGARDVPPADVALCLNLAHHLLVRGPRFVAGLFEELLAKAPVLIVEMGSFTEDGPWVWRSLMAQHWDSDEAMWAELFASARWRRPLSAHPYQGGRRVMWKLAGPLEKPYAYDVLGRYRRAVATDPAEKILVEVAGEDDAPAPFGTEHGDLCPDVMFYRLRRTGTAEEFWGKRYTGWRAAPERRRSERALHAFLRSQPFNTSLPVEEHDEFGSVYPFDPELFAGGAVHFWGRTKYFGRAEAEQIERFARQLVSDGEFANLPVYLLADFQTVRTSVGLTFIDFEPGYEFRAVAAYLRAGEGESDRRERAGEIAEELFRCDGVSSSTLPAEVVRDVATLRGMAIFRHLEGRRARFACRAPLRRAVDAGREGRLPEAASALVALARPLARLAYLTALDRAGGLSLGLVRYAAPARRLARTLSRG